VFKIVESVSLSPIRLPVKPGIIVKSGHVVTIEDYNGYTVINICNGTNPFALVGKKCIGGNEVNTHKMANIYPQRMIVELDNFDRKNDVEIGNSLYCSTSGVLTSKKPFNSSVPLAKVIYAASVEKNHMQILWL
jgi:hypothetical protein